MTAYDTTQGDDKSLAMLRAQFQNYASAKDREIEEWRMAHRYYSGRQISAAEEKVLAKRKQPIIIFNRVARKIDGVVGVVRKLRSDPKAFPTRPNEDAAAELATQVVRYVCDASDFEAIEAEAVLAAGIIGYGGVELGLRKIGEGDEVEIELIDFDSRSFFYDPRSFKADFSDARFMGTHKWVSEDEIEEIAPGMGEKVRGAADGGFTTQADIDRDDKWRDDKGRVRLVDHWYIKGGKWRWCLHVGTVKLAEGDSPFFDEKGRSICKFRVFSAYIDDEGDRYGFVRNMKGPQDAMNQHRSKAMHIMNTRQIIARRGSFPDIEKVRIEAQRPDGVIEFDGTPDDFKIDQPAQEFIQQTQYFKDAKDEIENFGPNQALLGTNMNAKSGRAIAMMQQSGLAELGPFLKSLRMWKLDVYRSAWTNTKRYVKGQRLLRLTGDEQAAQFVEVNKLAIDEYGQPFIVNNLGAIDVDIRMEEGPDTENIMGDVFDTLQSIAQNGTPVPPSAIIEMSALPSSVKDKVLKALEPPPNPAKEQADMALVQQEIEKANKLQAETFNTMMQALLNQQKLMMGGEAGMMQQKHALAQEANAMQPPQQEIPVAPEAPPEPSPVEIIQVALEQNGNMMAQAIQAMAQSNDQLGQAILQQGQMTQNGLSQLSSALMAPTESQLVRDPKTGRAVASRSVRVMQGVA